MKDKLVKMPTDLFKQIEIMAKRNTRSVNGQIVFMLKEQLKK